MQAFWLVVLFFGITDKRWPKRSPPEQTIAAYAETPRERHINFYASLADRARLDVNGRRLALKLSLSTVTKCCRCDL